MDRARWLELALEAANSEAGVEALSQAWAALRRAVRAAHQAGPSPDGRLPERLRPALGQWWSSLDRFIGISRAPLPVSCQAGCVHCCMDNPRGTTGVELLVLAEAVDALPEAARIWSRVAEAARAWEERMARLPDADAAVAETKRARDPCPLLSEQGRCRVYEARPVACRSFFSLTEPERCRKDHPQHEQAQNPQLQPGPAIRASLWEISELLRQDELPDDLRSGLAALGRLRSSSGG